MQEALPAPFAYFSPCPFHHSLICPPTSGLTRPLPPCPILPQGSTGQGTLSTHRPYRLLPHGPSIQK